jgi:hypothetical protein
MFHFMFASGSLTLAGMHTIKRPACNGQGNILNHFQRINDLFETACLLKETFAF